MDHIERMVLRMREHQPHIPSWAKAEHMERIVPQKELWAISIKSDARNYKKNRSRRSHKKQVLFGKRLPKETTSILAHELP
jgi:hypothetical protein